MHRSKQLAATLMIPQWITSAGCVVCMTDLQRQLNQLAKATHVFVMQSGISPLLRHTRPASHWNNSHNIFSTVDCSGADSDHHLARLYKPHALLCMTERSSHDLHTCNFTSMHSKHQIPQAPKSQMVAGEYSEHSPLHPETPHNPPNTPDPRNSLNPHKLPNPYQLPRRGSMHDAQDRAVLGFT